MTKVSLDKQLVLSPKVIRTSKLLIVPAQWVQDASIFAVAAAIFVQLEWICMPGKLA